MNVSGRWWAHDKCTLLLLLLLTTCIQQALSILSLYIIFFRWSWLVLNCLSVCLSAGLQVCLFVCLFVRLSVCLTLLIPLPVCLPACLPACLSVCLCLSVSVSVSVSVSLSLASPLLSLSLWEMLKAGVQEVVLFFTRMFNALFTHRIRPVSK